MPAAPLLAHPVFSIIAFLTVLLLIATVNAVVMIRLDAAPPLPAGFSADALPRLSVLVPARNEELNIGPCLASLLSQDYPNYEVLALDDHSTDTTGHILAELTQQHDRLRVLNSRPLPTGWLGKNWACHQLSEAAEGELLLFVDADTIHAPATLSRAVSVLLAKDLDMLTALPRQVVASWGERLIVPILYFCLAVFLPLPLAHRLRMPLFTAAIGQFMLFRRAAYDRIGGYAAVRAHGSDDMALARRVKAERLPWRMADAGACTNTRMYRSFGQAYAGLSKNLFAVFDYRLLPFLFAWLWLGYLFFRPPVELALTILNNPHNRMVIGLCLVAILEAFLVWALVIFRFRFPRYLFAFYPAIVLLNVWIALRSVALTMRGQASWKGRLLERPKIRWI